MANTADAMGEAATLDALVSDTLATFEDDRVTEVCQYGLAFKSSLVEVSLPSCANVDSYAFRNDASLEVLRLGGSGLAMEGSAFAGCDRLAHLVLTSSEVALCTAPPGPIASRQGAVYVPQELVAAYEADVSWGQCVILPLSEFPWQPPGEA